MGGFQTEIKGSLSKLAITRSLSRSTYENFILLKNIATARRLEWKERKSYRYDLVALCRLSYRSRTNVVTSRAFSVPCKTRRHSTSSYELCTSCYKLLQFATLRPSSDELLVAKI